MPAKDSTAKPKFIDVPRVGYMANRGGASSKPYRHLIPSSAPEGVTTLQIVELLTRLTNATHGYERGIYDDVVRDWAEFHQLIAPEYFYMSTDVAQYLVWAVTPKAQEWLAQNKEVVREYFSPRIEQAQRELGKMQAACA